MNPSQEQALPYPGLEVLGQSHSIQVGERRLMASPLDLSQMPKLAIPEKIAQRMLRIVGVRFSETGRVYDFDAGNFRLQRGDAVVAELPEKGLRLGWVSKPPLSVDVEGLNLHLKPLHRLATSEDLSNVESHQEREKKALQKVKELTSKYQLPMHIMAVEYSLDLKKATVYFNSETRVDFRNLLKELLLELKARVELRQIGVRDETKMKGGLGACGEEQCCSRFLNRFHPVSIKMAKNQGLSLKPTKVTGNCGRLKCCLAYEDETYELEKKSSPKKGSRCTKKCGNACGVIQEVDVLRKLVTVRFDDGNVEILKASDIIEQSTAERDKMYPNEFRVASSDDLETTDVERIGRHGKQKEKHDNEREEP